MRLQLLVAGYFVLAAVLVTLPGLLLVERSLRHRLEAAGSEHAPQGSETILLAEDEPQVRELALRALTGLGYHVLAAGSGGEALELARRQGGPIDLLVTDVVTPELAGRELADRLRASRPGLRVLYIRVRG